MRRWGPWRSTSRPRRRPASPVRTRDGRRPLVLALLPLAVVAHGAPLLAGRVLSSARGSATHLQRATRPQLGLERPLKAGHARPPEHRHRGGPRGGARCPWVEASLRGQSTPELLAAEVVGRMTLAQEAEFVVLAARNGYENLNVGIPALCIPPLSLSDGPNGVSFHVHGVTQLPSSIGVAASFDPAVAFATGQVGGAEARTKGIDVLQGPELNLARVPVSGRIFEGYGEDPTLAALMGVANVEGIQSEGVMADAKHLSAYNQETDRVRLDQVVSDRALVELYDVPFEAAVEQGHVASVMCSYGELNGVNDCSDPLIYQTLSSWGFDGFVRSDLNSVPRAGLAFRAGLDLIKPSSAAEIVGLVQNRTISRERLDDAVGTVLAEMFRFGMIAHPRRLELARNATSPAHARVARWAAERSMVLLKDAGGILPLTRTASSIAVIGSSASDLPRSAGYGSAFVNPPYVVTPLSSIRRYVSPRTKVTYSVGGPGGLRLEPVPARELVSGVPLPRESRPVMPAEPGSGDLRVDLAPHVSAQAATAQSPGRGEGWSSWSAVLKVPRSGTYEFSLEQNGDTWFSVDGRPVMSMPGLHGRSIWATTVRLRAHQRYSLSVKWYAVTGESIPEMGLANVTPQIDAAVATARAARVAVVFVSDWNSEGADRPNLELPGDANALVQAVAAANPRTVVVLNTGGAVTMPWIDSVRGVLEAWYPGQEDGAATAAVLFGDVDPSGRLPLTFPAASGPAPISASGEFPGVDSKVMYREGLDIGYRWYQAHQVAPLFPFGFGLSYTSFRLSGASLHTSGGRVAVSVRVTNTGQVAGTEVVQVYLGFPPGSGEPPQQLRAFGRVTLDPSATKRVTLYLDQGAFEADIGGTLQTVPGTYEVGVGTSSASLPFELPTSAP
ncbi:MAG: Beta-glucosidase [Acidimicrobiaceae bacterium]|nr:Beta-glucosidase [Acidimicrobiaceae bacterium]